MQIHHIEAVWSRPVRNRIRTTRTSSRRLATVTRSIVALAIVITACSGGNPSDTAAAPAPTIPPAASRAPDPVETPCVSASPAFTARGTVSVLGGSTPDARQFSDLDWLFTPGCERVVFSFLTDQSAPASSIGLSRLEFFPKQALLRVTMPRGVDVTGIADVLVDGALIQRAFVVRSRSGELAVNLHMNVNTPVEARGLLIGSPARLVIDVRPGPDDDTFGTARPTVGTSVVLLAPAQGVTEYPLRIRGYARTSTDVVSGTVSGTGDSVERRITVARSDDAWGEFAVTISEGPTGSIELEISADQGGLDDDGVIITLETR